MVRFRVKVKRRETTYLWGGPGVKSDGKRILQLPVLLSFRVDDLGEEVEFGYKATLPVEDDGLGKLRPGESYLLSLEKLTAVWARTASNSPDSHDSFVECELIMPVISS